MLKYNQLHDEPLECSYSMRLLFILSLTRTQVLPRLCVVLVLLYGSLKQQYSVRNVSVCQALQSLTKRILVINQRVIFLKSIYL